MHSNERPRRCSGPASGWRSRARVSAALLLCGSLLCAVACGGGSTPAVAVDAGADQRESEVTAPEVDAADTREVPRPTGPIVISSLSVTPGELDGAGIVTFEAQVTPVDAAGLSGVLEDDVTGAKYADFASRGAGRFVSSVSWNGMSATRAISFAPPGEKRRFRARFVNADRNENMKTVALDLHCGRLGAKERYGACAGVCTDFWADFACGQCDRRCGADTGCDHGTCAITSWTPCMLVTKPTTCAEVCAATGHECLNACGIDRSGARSADTCETIAAGGSAHHLCVSVRASGSLECCCQK